MLAFIDKEGMARLWEDDHFACSSCNACLNIEGFSTFPSKLTVNVQIEQQ